MEVSSTARERKHERLALMLPVKVRVHSPDGSVCEEEALMQDVSQGGMAFRARMPLRKGQVVRLSAPVPKTLREFGRDSAAYQVYGIVRNILVDDEACRVGVMFFGEQPPRGYARNPSARFLLPSDLEPAPPRRRPSDAAGPDPGGKRRHQRFEVLVEIELLYVDEWGNTLDQELTVTENVSMGGARVVATHPFAVGSVVLLRHPRSDFETRAEVVGSFVGRQGMRRLNLKFLDQSAAVRLLKAS